MIQHLRQATIAPHGAPTTAKIIEVAIGSATASETTQFVDDASASRSICLGLKVRKGQNEKGENTAFARFGIVIVGSCDPLRI